MKRFLQLSKLTKGFAGSPVPVVRDFDLVVQEGEFVSLIGHSGCGKSTVLAMVAGLVQSDMGGVILCGREVREPGPDRAMVFQSPCLLPWLTAIENVLLALTEKQPRLGRAACRERAEHWLVQVGLEHALHVRPAELSAGMRQRVGLARAFALSPRLLLLDEPFGMLDSITRVEMQLLLAGLGSREPCTTLMVTHDVDEALFLSDRVVMMTSGPAARVGEIVDVTLPRPRRRPSVHQQASWLPLRDRLLTFLESQPHAA
jgi:nitrate/nitrite transport system ATP-binding protein